MALFVWCSLSLLLSETEWGPSQPSAILPPQFCSMADILELVSIHDSNGAPRRDIISLTGVRGRIIRLSWPRAWANLMLNPVRPWTASQKPQDRGAIDYHFSSFCTALADTLSSKPNQKTSAANLVSPQPLCCDMDNLRRSLKSHVVYGRATPNLANLVELFLTPIWWPSGAIVNWQQHS